MCKDDDDAYSEDDVEWHTGGCDDELEESGHTVSPPTDDLELLEQFDGNLEGAEASASEVYASASRSFQETRQLISRVKSARDYFFLLLVLALLTAWFSHPLIANLQSLAAKARRARGKERKTSS